MSLKKASWAKKQKLSCSPSGLKNKAKNLPGKLQKRFKRGSPNYKKAFAKALYNYSYEYYTNSLTPGGK